MAQRVGRGIALLFHDRGTRRWVSGHSTPRPHFTTRGKTRCGPEGSRKIMFPDYVTTAQDGGKVVSLRQRPPLPPGKIRRESKSVPLQARSGPEGSRKLRLPDFVTTAQDVGKVVSLAHRPPLPPGNTPGTHFC